MQSTAAVAGAKTRGQRQTVSEQRWKLAKGLVEGQVFALESADDAEGFSFWLAVAQGASFTYSGVKKTEDGVVFTRYEVASTLTCGTMNVFLPPPLQFSNSHLKSEQLMLRVSLRPK